MRLTAATTSRRLDLLILKRSLAFWQDACRSADVPQKSGSVPPYKGEAFHPPAGILTNTYVS